MKTVIYNSTSDEYEKLVSLLYPENDARKLSEMYEHYLSYNTEWMKRTTWFGLLIKDDTDQIIAHALICTPNDKPVIYVGFVELVEDKQVAQYLVDSVKEKLAGSLKGKTMYLPVSISIWHAYRFKCKGEYLPLFDMPQKPYYPALFQGIIQDKEYFSSYRKCIKKINKPKDISPYTIRNLSKENITTDLNHAYLLASSIFDLDHSVISKEEFFELYSDNLKNCDPSFVLFAEDGDKPVGFCYSVVWQNDLYIKTLGILSPHRKKSVGKALYETVSTRALKEGCHDEYYIFLKDDRLISRLLSFGTKRISRYILFKEKFI